MNLNETVTPTEAAKRLNMDVRTFKRLAKTLGFTKYPGTTPRKIRYSIKDIEAKRMTPLDEIKKPKKKRRKIRA